MLFPAILVTQVLAGAMNNTPPIGVHGVGDISVVQVILFEVAEFCTFVCGALAGILHIYARTTLLHRFDFAFPLQSSTLYFATLLFTFGV